MPWFHGTGAFFVTLFVQCLTDHGHDDQGHGTAQQGGHELGPAEGGGQGLEHGGLQGPGLQQGGAMTPQMTLTTIRYKAANWLTIFGEK